jgi:beta-lactamase superfamily II metal-dependent hydrolase
MFHNGLCSLAAACALLLAGTAGADAKGAQPPALKIISVDVEGGTALLFVTPEGKSLLVDTGWPPGMGGPRQAPGGPPPAGASSAEKIAAAADSLGVSRIDYLIVTHYHVDHLGGLESLIAKLPVGTFIDHGPNRQPSPPNAKPSPFSTATLYEKYQALVQGHDHIVAKVGQTLDIGSMHLTFVTSDGEVPATPLPGAGQSNPLCDGVPDMARDGGEENSRSVGTLITFGKTRILELGDLSWNKEKALLCPVNKVGPVDIYVVTQHGSNLSSSPPTAALDPIVAVMGNGRTKGGDDDPIRTVEKFPHLEGFWREHYAPLHPELNGDPDTIANLDWIPDQNYTIDLSITPDGAITVSNSRNRFTKTYRARGAR